MGLKKSLSSLIKIFLLLLICVAASLIVVWPLWKFSTSLPSVYTIIVLVLCGIILLYLIVKKIMKSSLVSVIRFFVNIILIFLTVFFSVKFVLKEMRLIALIILAGSIAVITIFNVLYSRFVHEK